jgi:hypothetical protein
MAFALVCATALWMRGREKVPKTEALRQPLFFALIFLGGCLGFWTKGRIQYHTRHTPVKGVKKIFFRRGGGTGQPLEKNSMPVPSGTRYG